MVSIVILSYFSLNPVYRGRSVTDLKKFFILFLFYVIISKKGGYYETNINNRIICHDGLPERFLCLGC